MYCRFLNEIQDSKFVENKNKMFGFLDYLYTFKLLRTTNCVCLHEIVFFSIHAVSHRETVYLFIYKSNLKSIFVMILSTEATKIELLQYLIYQQLFSKFKEKPDKKQLKL